MKRLIATLALAIVAAPLFAAAAPSFEVRSDNSFTLRGHVAAEPANVEAPERSVGFPLVLESAPIDGAVTVACAPEVALECERLMKGDRVLIRGEVRVVEGAAIFYARHAKQIKGGTNR